MVCFVCVCVCGCEVGAGGNVDAWVYLQHELSCVWLVFVGPDLMHVSVRVAVCGYTVSMCSVQMNTL